MPEQKTVNTDLQVEIPRQQVENDHLQAQKPANNDRSVRRLSRSTRQPDKFVPGAKNVTIKSW